MLRFLPYNIQLLTRTLSSNLGCLKNISRGHLSSYFLLSLEETPHSSISWKLELWRKSLSVLFSTILANVKNNCYYKICLYFNRQFSQIQGLKIPFLSSRIICSCPFSPLYLNVLELLSVVFWVSLFSCPDKISTLMMHVTAIGHCKSMCRRQNKNIQNSNSDLVGLTTQSKIYVPSVIINSSLLFLFHLLRIS